MLKLSQLLLRLHAFRELVLAIKLRRLVRRLARKLSLLLLQRGCGDPGSPPTESWQNLAGSRRCAAPEPTAFARTEAEAEPSTGAFKSCSSHDAMRRSGVPDDALRCLTAALLTTASASEFPIASMCEAMHLVIEMRISSSVCTV